MFANSCKIYGGPKRPSPWIFSGSSLAVSFVPSIVLRRASREELGRRTGSLSSWSRASRRWSLLWFLLRKGNLPWVLGGWFRQVWFVLSWTIKRNSNQARITASIWGAAVTGASWMGWRIGSSLAGTVGERPARSPPWSWREELLFKMPSWCHRLVQTLASWSLLWSRSRRKPRRPSPWFSTLATTICVGSGRMLGFDFLLWCNSQLFVPLGATWSALLRGSVPTINVLRFFGFPSMVERILKIKKFFFRFLFLPGMLLGLSRWRVWQRCLWCSVFWRSVVACVQPWRVVARGREIRRTRDFLSEAHFVSFYSSQGVCSSEVRGGCCTAGGGASFCLLALLCLAFHDGFLPERAAESPAPFAWRQGSCRGLSLLGGSCARLVADGWLVREMDSYFSRPATLILAAARTGLLLRSCGPFISACQDKGWQGKPLSWKAWSVPLFCVYMRKHQLIDVS